MGQNSSAPARPPRVSANATATADGDVGVRATVHRDDEQQQQQDMARTKRRNLRNTLRALVPKAAHLNKRACPASMSFVSSASAAGDLEAIAGTGGRSGSRRWSRARRASSFVPPPASAPHEDGEVDEFGLLAAVADEARHTDADADPDPHRLDEEADEEQVQVQPRERPATPMPPASSPPYSSSSASPSTSFPAAPQSQSQVPQAPTPAEGGLGGPPPIPPRDYAPRASQTAQHLPRGTFPPPGTLVVVQGVVHTTDVPRPGGYPPSSPSPLTSSGAANDSPSSGGGGWGRGLGWRPSGTRQRNRKRCLRRGGCRE
ncbi:hypothetical protein B0H16DRAFT_584605 [Mycena metata]|uniref:Uncharacterized protein n=1 Tax=Mycena metata TaxID=1033252 RepID=A0AAD7MDN6_9AGAR|nr:hypothetical protein B0H16DRAFT_584605 [Mycena metata]